MIDAITAWDGALCSNRYDEESGAFFTIAIHSLDRGPAAGGTRAAHYMSFGDAVADATRLASAMTLKMAAADLPMGGGKSVIALPAPRNELDDRTWERILTVHAENLATLKGSYWTGPDVGTSSADMDVLHALSGFAFGRSEAADGPGSSAPSTAQGVYVGILRAAWEAGMDGVAGRRIVVQGLGAVGMDLVRLALKDGAEVLVTDIDRAACEYAEDLGATVVSPEDVLGQESDVFVPCAMGGVVTVEVAQNIRTRVIAGAANNLLAHPDAADVLSRRGIVLAPDFVTNAGGAIHLVGREILGWTAQEVAVQVDGIAGTLGEVFRAARTRDISTQQAAVALADSRLNRPALARGIFA
jgi:leucine dehydrogenase